MENYATCGFLISQRLKNDFVNEKRIFCNIKSKYFKKESRLSEVLISDGRFFG